MKRTFVTNLILLVGLNLLVKPFYILGIETEIQNRVGPEVFGSYFALINFSFLLNILPDMGTNNWNTKHIAQNSHLLSKHFSRIFSLRLCLSGGYLVVLGLAAFLMDYRGEQITMLGILALGQVFSSMIIYMRSNLSGLHLFRQDSVISVLDRLLMIGAMSVLLWGGYTGTSFRIEWLVIGQCVAYGITFFTALILVLRRSGRLELSWDRAFNFSILRQSFPYALMILVSMIAYRIDSVMLERMNGPKEAGIYAMGFRFYEAVNMIAYLFAVLLLPIFARMLKQQADVSAVVGLSFQILFCGTLTLALTALFFNEPIFAWIYDHQSAEAREAFMWLMWSAMFFSLQYVFGTLITASGNMRPLIILAATGMIINISLNLALIPIEGSRGAAKASAITQFVVLVLQVWLVLKFHALSGFQAIAWRTVLFTLTSVGAGIFFAYSAIFAASPAYTIGAFLLTCVFASLITGMLSIRRFAQMIRQQQ